jgi:tetratricopeptide (TPR) repeat protein
VTAHTLIVLLAAATATAGSTPPPASTPTSTSTSTAASPEARLEAANALYLAGDFDGAARAYRALVDEGFEGSALHLNLGNALARAGASGQAMASWLRALRLDPSDADARANLELARAQNVDRLVGAADPPVTARILERTAEGLAVGLFGAAWVALWGLLWLRGRAARRARRPLGVAALLAALAAVAGGALVAGKAAERRSPAAVVVSPVAPVREGPQRTLKAAFELHEGTSVRVLEARGDLARVQLDNGLTGWVASSDLEVI